MPFDGVDRHRAVRRRTLKLVVDTSRRPVRGVVDELLDSLPVSDLSIVDPPLEQVIGSIYDAPSAT